jgi:hypothetical protein
MLKVSQPATFWLPLCTILATIHDRPMRQSLLPRMASSLKKVILRNWNREWLSGYLAAGGFVKNGQVDLLDLAGKVQATALTDLKWICFVRDFNSGEITNPERLLRKTFAGRPRAAGVWIRLRLTDQDELEGLAANDASLINPDGLFLIPPDTRSNTQRIYLPSSSIDALEVISVIGSAQKPAPRKPAARIDADTQPVLFPKVDSR